MIFQETLDTTELLSFFASRTEVKALCQALFHTDSGTVRIEGLCCSAVPLAFSAAGTIEKQRPIVLFVLADADEAGYFYQDLVQMQGDDSVLYFPSSYRRAIKYNQKDAANEVLRTAVLGRITAVAAEGGLFIVTYPEALAEKVVAKTVLTDHSLKVHKGGTLDFSRLEQQLDSLGFVHVDYVYEPGQYAIRGSVFDVYSFASESPYRIDFFGDDIESIRTFDVQSQLSEGFVDQIVIVPEMQSRSAQSISILEFLPENTIVVTHNKHFLAERIEKIYQEGFSLQAQLEEQAMPEYQEAEARAELAETFRTRVVNPTDFARQLNQMRQAIFSAGHNDTPTTDSSEAVVRFDTTAQPLFHKNFELVENECQRLLLEGYRIFILADSSKQIERLQDIFSAFQPPVTFEPVLHVLHEGFIDHTAHVCLFTDHQIFDRFHKYSLKSEKARRGKVALTLKEIHEFAIGDYVVHIDHGVGRFGGLVNVPNDSGTGYQEMIKLTYQNDDTVYVSIHALHKISKYRGKEGEPPRISKLGTGAWERMKERVKAKVKDIARDLIRLYSQRLKEKGFAFSPDSYLQHELEASFAYEDTPDQLKATQDVKEDMERERPMDRLVCGDVGFGKTEIAIRAAFKAATDSKQVAVLVPTTVLAYQHYKTFQKRLKDFPVTIEYLSRARSTKEQKDLLARLSKGEIDIVVGTHKLISKTVKFKDLGLLIIDEEQKFGVSVKEKLRQVKTNVDTLTMSATPIPRTLQFSLMGARDLSVIQTPPPNRHPIQTEIHTFSPEVIAEAINFEMSRNGQVFFVNNKISNLPELEALIHRLVPDARVCIGHGRMEPKELEQIVFDFMNYEYDVLLSTTIVENGIDVPNANTIIVNAAQNYGLSDLHQMRGRVGRGNKKAFCYLLAPPLAVLPDDSRRRLQAIETFSDLGSGLNIAMQDLDIRGAGNMLGAEQSGFIADLGYETYQKVLGEAINELKNEELTNPADAANHASQTTGSGTNVFGAGTGSALTFVLECNVESDIPAFFSETYVPSSSERMTLYRELDSLSRPEQIEEYKARLRDRFGAIPQQAEELIRIVPLKWAGQRLGIERLVLKQGRMICYLVANRKSFYYQSAAFSHIIRYATRHARECQFREGDKPGIVIRNVTSVSQAQKILSDMEATE